MRILLSPDRREPGALGEIYRGALREAQELYVASAFLTSWNPSWRVGSHCRRSTFLIGTDFGLTRKTALQTLLRALRGSKSCFVGAVTDMQEGAFHPKFLLWRSHSGRRWCLVGSSNLSAAGLGVNCEANVLTEVNQTEFGRLAAWIERLGEAAVPVTEDWILHHYREASHARGRGNLKGRATSRAPKLHMPVGPSYEAGVRRRRKEQAAFAEIGPAIERNARKCASGKIGKTDFWGTFWQLWSRHPSRFQGQGLQIRGKGADWRKACLALINVLDAARKQPGPHADHVVAVELDHLAELKNPARGAWLSEMLCHYFPDSYPVLNAPVFKWLRANKWRGRRGASEGQAYVELARQLRHAVGSRPAGARNLAELDHAIWQWIDNRRL